MFWPRNLGLARKASGSTRPRHFRALIVSGDRRTAALIGEMLQQSWSDGLVVAHAGQLSDATHELLEHTAELRAARPRRLRRPDREPSSRSARPLPTCRSWCSPSEADEENERRSWFVKAGAPGWPVQTPAVPGAAEAIADVLDQAEEAPGGPRRTPRAPRPPRRVATGRFSSTVLESRWTARRARRLDGCFSSTSTTSRDRRLAQSRRKRPRCFRARRAPAVDARPMDTVARLGATIHVPVRGADQRARNRADRGADGPAERLRSPWRGDATVTVSIRIAMVIGPRCPPRP